MSSPPLVGVVGHIEWMQFAVVPQVPGQGEIVHASAAFEVAAGGGAVAAAHLAELAGTATFLTAVGDDDHGARSCDELVARGVTLHAAVRPGATTRRGFTYLDDDHERTITLLDPRLVPHASDDLPWELTAGLDAVYFTGGDADALRAARAARVLVATPRALDVIAESGVQLDVLVSSANDPGEQVAAGALDPAPLLVVRTAGAAGGSWSSADGDSGTWAPAPLPGPPVDSYGSGDAFAAGLTYGLGAGMPVGEAAALGARRGALCLTGRGPYEAIDR
jgi:ribokinase